MSLCQGRFLCSEPVPVQAETVPSLRAPLRVWPLRGVQIVVRYLSVKSLGRAICVCKSWRELAREDQGLWRRHCELRYPAVLSPAIARQIADTCGFRRFFLSVPWCLPPCSSLGCLCSWIPCSSSCCSGPRFKWLRVLYLDPESSVVVEAGQEE